MEVISEDQILFVQAIATTCDEIVEEGHRRPRGSAVLGGYVVPSEIGGEIHGTAPRQKALRGKVGTVTSPAREVEEQRIATERPGFGIIDGTLTVVGFDKDHEKAPFQWVFYSICKCLRNREQKG